jgi:hypothetical protein
VGPEAWAGWIGKRIAPSVMAHVGAAIDKRVRSGA